MLSLTQRALVIATAKRDYAWGRLEWRLGIRE